MKKKLLLLLALTLIIAAVSLASCDSGSGGDVTTAATTTAAPTDPLAAVTFENVTVKNVALTGRTDYQGNAMGRIRLGSVAGIMGGKYATIVHDIPRCA